mmetsp:Transcript_17688/g.43116  ORF Transcript_17688/g.43116 Transcript_17688/m.43116 type:complete len:154 (+) Transcript_17688:529-990(+)
MTSVSIFLSKASVATKPASCVQKQNNNNNNRILSCLGLLVGCKTATDFNSLRFVCVLYSTALLYQLLACVKAISYLFYYRIRSSTIDPFHFQHRYILFQSMVSRKSNAQVLHEKVDKLNLLSLSVFNLSINGCLSVFLFLTVTQSTPSRKTRS